MAETFDMIAKTFFGLEGVLADELTSLGAQDVRTGRRMAAFRGDLRLMYRANVCARTAVRVLKPIHAFVAADETALYRGIGEIDWLALLEADGSLAIDPVVHSSIFTNSLYASQLAKDAIVDQIRDRTRRRPSVDRVDPDLRINLHVDQDRVTVYLDSSGDSLHKRGYRAAAGEAPINEVLAAGILRLTTWDGCSPLSDFMCGSGTFVIEAALAARAIAPGLIRKRFGYMRWTDFCAATHGAVLEEARRQVRGHLSFPIQGSDLDQRTIAAARDNAARAGVEGDIRWLVENFDSVAPPASSGMLVTNPPYDKRMKAARMGAVYRRLGDVLKRYWAGHTAFILTGNPRAAKHIGLRPSGKTRLFNGPIECRLLKFDLFASPTAQVIARPPLLAASDDEDRPARPAADPTEPFANRLSRMAKHWHRWARRQGITCYRIYDRDVPDVPLAIDWYEGHLLVTEHDRPHGRTEIEQLAWLDRMVDVASKTLGVAGGQITLVPRWPRAADVKQRRQSPHVLEVQEHDLHFEVHLGMTKETGLELDQRTLRGMLRTEAAGKRVLNLFGRTATATVAAARGGANSTTTVEASRSLVDWARRNLQYGGWQGSQHRVICQDPRKFLGDLDPADGQQFDLAIVRPPSFDGTRRPGVWNVQDGHVELLNRLLTCLSSGGKIYFVTTFRRLTFHASQIAGATVREITRQTVPPDFRNKKVHRAWTLICTR